MSALQKLLGRVWAVVWVRWQLLRAGLRQRGSATSDPASYYLADAETPVKGEDYPAAEIPVWVTQQMDSISVDALDRSRRTSARRGVRRRTRRRHSLALAGAALLLFAMLGAGASALIGGSTGVPAVDELLGARENMAQRGEEAGGGERPSLNAKAGGSTVSVELWDGREKLTTTSYVSADDLLCSALVLSGGTGTGVLPNAAGCAPPAAIVDRLAADGVVVPDLVPGRVVPIRGYVPADVRSLRVHSPLGAMKVALGDRWQTGLPEVPEMRPFLAVLDLDGLRPGADRERAVDPRDYRFTVQRDDGQEFDVTPDAPHLGG